MCTATLCLEGGKKHMSSQKPTTPSSFQENTKQQVRSAGHSRHVTKVTQARSKAQKAKLDRQSHTPQQQKASRTTAERKKNAPPQKGQAKRPTNLTVERAIDTYLDDHIGGNHSDKTLEWHRTALGLFQTYLQEQQGITLVSEIDASAITAWFTYLRKTPGGHGKMRTERTVQTYARSARAFFHWLVRRGTLEQNPFDQVAFPKVGKPLIKTMNEEEFEQLLLACAPPNEEGPFAERAAVRNRAILWLFYDSGIRLSELTNLRVGDLDRKHGVITVKGKGAKERRIALGQNCLRNLLYYLDHHRPDEQELEEWGSLGEDHLFLSEIRRPMTKNGITLLFARLKKRAGITGKRISPHILRHTFAIRYLKLGKDPFSLQELLGHEDMATVKLYMHMNDEDIQEQKRKYSPGDHLPASIPGPRETRRRGYRVRKQ
jgi:integrase/recombinase XerD